MPKLTKRILSTGTMLTLLCACLLPVSTAVAASGTNMVLTQPSNVQSQPDRIDINSANLTELQSLPGIGKVYSKKIVASRPYQSIKDLQTKKVLPPKTYKKIQNMLSVGSTH